MKVAEADAGKRILVCSSLVKDNALTVSILQEAGLEAVTCESVKELCRLMAENASAVLIAIEMISGQADCLRDFVNNQPAWSDLPFVVLTGAAQSAQIISLLHALLRNVTILERPLRIVTLVSSLQAAVAARRRQYQVRDLLSDLERSRFEAEAANRTKSAFLANMSHEIRTPLGIILGFSELIANEIPVNDESMLYLQTIKRNGQDLSKLIDELLDLSKVEAGKLDIEIIPTPLAELLNETCHSFTEQARRRNVQLTFTMDKAIPATIQTDPTRLRQILKNIIGNALKFTQEGTVTVAARHFCGTGLKPAQLQLTVTDTGRGISPSEQKRLFEAFNQADSSTTRSYGGTGLGLFLSRRLARALGGDIELATSALGKGSSFVISIESEGPGGAPAIEAMQRCATKSHVKVEITLELEGLEILVAEDAPDNQLLIRRILTRRGATVRIAENGEEAIKEAMSRHYDIILMDVQMPLLDGYGATSQLRQMGYKGSIVALSAHAMKDERAKSIAVGCNEHLTKPVDVKRLVGVIIDHTVNRSYAHFH